MSVVESTFEEMSSTILLKNFVTLKAVMKLVMSHDGGNQFKIPHVKKSKRLRAGEDITTVHCNADTVEKAKLFLKNAGIKE